MSGEQNTGAKSGKKSFAVVGVLVLLLAAGGSMWMMRHRSVSAASPDPVELKVKALIHLESFVVNLADRDEKTFLRVGMELGIAKELGKPGVGLEPIPSIRDAVIGVLTSCRADDLLTPEGKQQLKSNLLNSLNERVPDLKVREIYFTDFLVQR